jgi:hypothetical protein
MDSKPQRKNRTILKLAESDNKSSIPYHNGEGIGLLRPWRLRKEKRENANSLQLPL